MTESRKRILLRRAFTFDLRFFLAPDSSSHQEPAQSQENKTRLAADHVPQQATRFIAIYFSKRFSSRGVKQVHQLRVVLLLKMVQRAPDHPVSSEFAPQSRQFRAS